MIYKLSVYINNLSFSNKLLVKIYAVLNENKYSNVWVKKSIQNGNHLEFYSENFSRLAALKELISDEILEYSSIVKDENKIKRQIIAASRVEGVEPELELKADGTVLLEKSKLSFDNSLYSKSTAYSIEDSKMELILYLEKEGYFTLDENKQNIVLTKLFLNLGLLFDNNLKLGYLSMKSNILFFNEQLKRMNIPYEKYQKYYDKVNSLDKVEQSFIDESIEIFIQENVNSFFKSFVNEIYNFFDKESRSGKLYTSKLSNGDSFIKTSREQGILTDFHKTLFTDKNFLNQHSSESFNIYRFTVDFLYQVMPLINTSPLRKQKITKMVCDKVEIGYNMSWQDSYQIMKDLFKEKEK